MSIAPICDSCGNELAEPGALVFGPPTGQGWARKYHLCVGCFGDHFVVFSEDHWTVEHSVACRVSGAMAACDFHYAIARVADADNNLMGRFRICEIDSEGLPSLVRA